MQKPEFYAAVYWIIKNEKWEVLFWKRCNTEYMNGYYELPAWHIEWYETYFEALQREMNEEIWIDIQESDVTLVHISHRIIKGERVYFDVYFNITNWKGELKNNEEERCEEIIFLNHKENKTAKFIDHTLKVFSEIEKGNTSSEIIY